MLRYEISVRKIEIIQLFDLFTISDGWLPRSVSINQDQTMLHTKQSICGMFFAVEGKFFSVRSRDGKYAVHVTARVALARTGAYAEYDTRDRVRLKTMSSWSSGLHWKLKRSEKTDASSAGVVTNDNELLLGARVPTENIFSRNTLTFLNQWIYLDISLRRHFAQPSFAYVKIALLWLNSVFVKHYDLNISGPSFRNGIERKEIIFFCNIPLPSLFLSIR